jgi:FlaA1/EpsC-like NDP-sugar epimerase
VRETIITYRRFLVVVVHLALWTASLVAALLLRFDFRVPDYDWQMLPIWLGIFLAAKTLAHISLGLFHGLWRYSGVRDLVALIKAAIYGTLAAALVISFLGPRFFPRSVYIVDWLASIMSVGGLRLGIRTLREYFLQPREAAPEKRRRILIVGAGDAGELIMREMTTRQRRYDVVGFVDDHPAKQSEKIHGVPVLGPIATAPALADEHQVDEIIVAIPSMSGKEMRAVVDSLSQSRAKIRTLPGVDHLIDGRVTVNQIQEVRIEDLLGREPVQLDMAAISEFLEGRCFLVTGAGGSIGSELCRQICRFKPSTLVLVDQAENNLFHIHRKLKEQFPYVKTVPTIADICDTRRMEMVFRRERPAVVFHAAAHKHVPMMEWNPGEAVKNNVFGTKKIADLAHEHNVLRFVMVSTDKAVNPTSIMGVSKRAAEIYVQALSQRSKTQFVTVRFGNVLGSEGSVIPLFKEQIAHGGPVTVTHPDMRRYFMTIPEACQLTLQAGTMGRGGEIFILDMGEPVKVVDLARDLIKLSGLTTNDVEIQFTGVRPGEKLFEELSTDEEHCDTTVHPKIFIGRFKPYAQADVDYAFTELHTASDGMDDKRLRRAFHALVPEFQASPPPSASLVASKEPARAPLDKTVN